jgi:hypothetical protein
MNRICFLLYLLFPASYFSFAQEDTQTSFITEDGIFTVSQTPKGKDMILCRVEIWDEMVKGTKYMSDYLSKDRTYKACIHISNKKQMQCKRGIGFRCGIFDCLPECKSHTAVIDAANRICPVTIQKNAGGTVTVFFLNSVNWNSLQND